MPEAPAPWTWLRQVHGARTVVVERPGDGAGAEADAAVTATPGCTLAVRTADCVPIVLSAGHGVDGGGVGGHAVGSHAVGVIHAGWRGLVAGVVGSAVAALRQLSSAPITATLGPSIHASCYEFDGPDRDELAGRFGTAVRATTSWGTPALDLRVAAVTALTAAGADTIHDDAPCTACDRRFFSHRARGERERFATLAWLP